jgi:hypothetical protein
MYVPFDVAVEHQRADISALFDQLLTVPWGPLCLLGQTVGLLKHNHMPSDAQWASFLAATVRWWPVYAEEGERYTRGFGIHDLWTVALPLKRQLVKRGLTKEQVPTVLPVGGLGALLAKHPDKFADVLTA